MKQLTASQKSKIRALAEIGTELRETAKGLSELRQQKVALLIHEKRELAKRQMYLNQVKLHVEMSFGLSDQDAREHVAYAQKPVDDQIDLVNALEESIDRLNERQSAIAADCILAAGLTEKLLAFSGLRHEDYRGADHESFGHLPVAQPKGG